MKRMLGIALALVFASSCAHMREPGVSLVSGADKIKLVEYISEKDMAHLDDVGFVKCSQCFTVKTLTTNQEACRNDLRNQAQALGGTTILIKEGYDAINDPNYAMVSNCVAAKGVVYRRK